MNDIIKNEMTEEEELTYGKQYIQKQLEAIEIDYFDSIGQFKEQMDDDDYMRLMIIECCQIADFLLTDIKRGIIMSESIEEIEKAHEKLSAKMELIIRNRYGIEQ